MSKNRTVQTNINKIKIGDTIIHKGQDKTVCAKDIQHDKLIGCSLFGDSYNSGHIPVIKIVYPRFYKDQQIE